MARVAGPLPQACLVVLRPLVEEKVKEQLEAAKPEPVIEEVVSGGAGPPRASRGPSPRPALRSPLALHFVPFPPPSFLSLPFSCLCPPPSCVPWDWVPPALTCICPLHRTWPTLHPGSLTGECRPWRTSADGAGALGAGLGPRAGPFHPRGRETVGPDLWLPGQLLSEGRAEEGVRGERAGSVGDDTRRWAAGSGRHVKESLPSGRGPAPPQGAPCAWAPRSPLGSCSAEERRREGGRGLPPQVCRPSACPPVAPVPSSVKWRSPLPGAPATGLGEGREGLVAWGLLSLEPEARRPGPCHPHVCIRCSTSRRWCGW